MADVEPVAPGGGPSRMFLVIALGLVGLLIIGVIAVGGILLLNSSTPRPAVTPTSVAKALPTNTNTRVLSTATATSTDTPTPGPTNTNVIPVAPVSGGDTTPTLEATAAVTGTVGTGTPGLPNTGVGEDLVVLAAGVVLVLIIFAARRARATGTA